MAVCVRIVGQARLIVDETILLHFDLAVDESCVGAGPLLRGGLDSRTRSSK
jgi:hypothetical protein